MKSFYQFWKSENFSEDRSDQGHALQKEQLAQNDFFYQKNKNLYDLSDFIKKEAKNMLPNTQDLAMDLSLRSARLWIEYFSQGINLSTGGVSMSFIKPNQVMGRQSLKTFNIYQNYVETNLSQADLQKYFIEEGLLEHSNDRSDLHISFSLGSHEGIMRVARCIYRRNTNEGMFLATSCYGLLAMALRTMEPVNYLIKFIDIDRVNGEKILLHDLKEQVLKHTNIKSLFIELKTMAGSVYSSSEFLEIVAFCKESRLFLIIDVTHIHMEFNPNQRFPDVYNLCQQSDYHDFVIVYTGSKTYGLERARVGFLLLDKRSQSLNPQSLDDDLSRTLGTLPDMPLEVAYSLVHSRVEDRKAHLFALTEQLRNNMNLMLAYLEGVNSPKIDPDLRANLERKLPDRYKNGIAGLKVLYKPEGGMALKVDTYELRRKYFTNILIYNSEIFCYVLNKISGVVTLHSYCLMDPKGFGIRLSFPIERDIHQGMQRIHDFVEMLTDNPTPNPYMPGIIVNQEYFFREANKSHSKQFRFFTQPQLTDHCGSGSSMMDSFRSKL